ncbi:MAG: GNAT family N-acetyltransferase [Christensenellaceae bacterium]|nr:GNAT family N-acetyltransferase [Christensenellaceae bacterium]
MITVRPTVHGDADILCALQKAAFQPLYELYHDAGNPCLRGPEDILRRLDHPAFQYFTILDGEEIIGGVVYRRCGRTPFVDELQAGEYYLLRIYVKPDCQSRGVGRTAILLCEKHFPDARKYYVDFPRELEKNRKCYMSAGYRDSGKELEAEPGLVLVAYEKDA